MEQVLGSPVGRRESRRQSRRDAIVAVAGRSFLERGYAGTTMSAIAATLGGSKGTLWSYFPSKEELFAAVIDQVTAMFRERLAAILDPDADFETTLRHFCVQFVEKVTSPDAIALHRLVTGEAGRFPEIGRIFYERAPRMTHGHLAAFLSGAMNRGLLRRDEPMVAARLLVSLCMSGCHHKLLMGLIDRASPQAIVEDAERAVGFFLRGFAARAEAG